MSKNYFPMIILNLVFKKHINSRYTIWTKENHYIEYDNEIKVIQSFIVPEGCHITACVYLMDIKPMLLNVMNQYLLDSV